MLNSYIRNFIARSHVAGSDFEKTEEICNWAASNGWSTTISFWTHPDEDKADVAEKYVKILKMISQKGLNCYISIKPYSLQFDLRLFEYIIKSLDNNKIRIHFDSTSPDLAENSLNYFKQAKALYDNLGYTIPARWLRSFNDANEMAWMNVPVRIVKGQWQDPDDNRTNVNENFLRLIRLMANRVPLIAIATHDQRLAEKSVELLKDSDTNFEIEQMFSLPIIRDLVHNNHKIDPIKKRLYISVGEPYLPYNLRNVWDRPAMIGWFFRDVFNLKRRYHFMN
jgi:proline dehydrogenase